MSGIQKINLDQLLDHLNDHKLYGFGIQSFFGTYLTVHYVNRFARLRAKELFREVASYVWQRLRTKKNQNSTILAFDPNKPLLTFISERRHIFAMNARVAENLQGEFQGLMLYDGNTSSLHLTGPLFTKNQIIKALSFSSGAKYGEVLKGAMKKIRSFLKKHELSVLRTPVFYIHMKRQIALLELFDRSFKESKPKYILTESDCYGEIAPLIIAAKINNIPTFTQVHGMLHNKLGYYPLLADYLFCWGNLQKQRLIAWGIPSEKIIVTGATQLENKLEDRANLILPNAWDIKENRFFLLATNPMRQEIRMDLLKQFIACIGMLPKEWIGLVRIHPSESPHDYEKITEGNYRVFICGDDILDYKGTLSLADHVVIYNSAFAIDALIHNKAVSQLNVSDSELGEMKAIIEMGAIPSFEHYSDLAVHCIRYEKDTLFKDHWTERRKNFVEQYCEDFGSSAAFNMVSFIKTKLNEPEKETV